MQHGFVKVAAVTHPIRVADPNYNAERIMEKMTETVQNGAKLVIFPELSITAYTCNELFLQDLLLRGAKTQLLRIAEHSKDLDALFFVGLPMERDFKLYNVAAAICHGEILALIPKKNIPSYAEFYETRYFTAGNEEPVYVRLGNYEVPFGTNILFACDCLEQFVVGCEICEDLWIPESPAAKHALAGANVLVNLSASSETVGKAEYRKMLLQSASGRFCAAYIYATAGEGESSQDLVFGGQCMIAENGTILAESKRFRNETIYADIDVKRLSMERRRMNTYVPDETADYLLLPFSLRMEETRLDRTFAPQPFVPQENQLRNERCEEILTMQAVGLQKRLKHTGCQKVILGLSGGLDSTLAALVIAKAFDHLSLDRSGIVAVTMPGFGTTGRTYQNACQLAERMHASLREISIAEAVRIHFRDIGQSEDIQDVTYENCQARERTQILMDLANKENALVIGTGDMSELALGWATYNGDHMSMYGVNVGVPKTLVRHLVAYYADSCGDAALCEVLQDVLSTPVSPELLPPKDGVIAQITEDVVGPYELHDFFLYYMLRCGYEPTKVYRIAIQTFAGTYTAETILKWLKTFYRRFFSQQFKRSCIPDGPKIGSVALSPRGDLRMPSDAVSALWLQELEHM